MKWLCIKKTNSKGQLRGKTYSRDTRSWFAINAILNLSNSKNADVSDVMISKRKFDISLYVTLVSLNESECICFNSRWTKLSSQSTEREKISTFGGYFSLPGRIITSCETVLFPLLSIYPRAHLKRFDWGLVKERLLYEGSIIWQKERLFPPEAKLVIREGLNRSVMLARRDSHVLLLCKTSQWKHKTQSWTRLKSDLSRQVIKLFKVIPGSVAIPYERCLHCKCITYSFCLLISVGLASLCWWTPGANTMDTPAISPEHGRSAVNLMTRRDSCMNWC